MAVRTKQLAHRRTTSGALTTLYTAPAGETVIVKGVTLYAEGATEVYVGIQKGAVRCYTWRQVFSGLGSFDKVVWWVLQPGDQLVWTATVGGFTMDVTAHGTELEGVAD